MVVKLLMAAMIVPLWTSHETKIVVFRKISVEVGIYFKKSI